jgi:hypothetical protein
VDEVRGKGAQVVVLLSHNGMDVDLKLAGRVTGIDAILGGHTHDGMPVPIIVGNKRQDHRDQCRQQRQVPRRAGPRRQGRQGGGLPLHAAAGVCRPAARRPRDAGADHAKVRAPYEAKLGEVLAVTEGTLYRRGNFNGSGDQLLLDALMDVQGAEIAFSPGFRWGTSLLPGQAITREWLMDMTATTYPYTTLTEMSGEMLKTVLEDVADNLFNPDPYYQQGGDMVRVGGLRYTCDPSAKMGKRIRTCAWAASPSRPAASTRWPAGRRSAKKPRRAANTPVWEVVCTMGALSDAYNMGDTTRLRQWALAAGVAILGFWALAAAGQIDPAKTLYAANRLIWLSALVGGALFGFGMVLASGCGSKTLVRMGGGSLKALVVFRAGHRGLRHAQGHHRGAARGHRRQGGRRLSRRRRHLARTGWPAPSASSQAAAGMPWPSAAACAVGAGGRGLPPLRQPAGRPRHRRGDRGAWWVSGHLGYLAEHPETLGGGLPRHQLGRAEA